MKTKNTGIDGFLESIRAQERPEEHSELSVVWGDVTVSVGVNQTPRETEDQLFRVLERLQKTMNGGGKVHDAAVM